MVLGIVLTLFSAKSIEKGMQKEMLQGLTAVTENFITMLNQVDNGDYKQDASGKVWKGKYELSENYTLEDQIKSTTGYDVTMFYGDTRTATSIQDAKTGKRIVGTKATDKVISSVLKNGNTYTSVSVKINGENYYCCYTPLKNSDGTIVGMAFAGIPSTDAQIYIQKQLTGLITLALVILLLVLIISIVIPTMIAREIVKEADVVHVLADGRLTAKIDAGLLKKRDELGQMAGELQHLKEQLISIVMDIRKTSAILQEQGDSLQDTASETSSTADDIARAVEDVAKGAVSQAEEIEKVSENISTMGDVIEEIVDQVTELDHISETMKAASDKSNEIIRELYETNDKTREAMSKIAVQVKMTNSSAQNISEAVRIITNIAEETNLLSLNASIEAARAGEAGRGFAVVATQIQKLAEQSNSSADEIQKVINELLQESEATVKVMDTVEMAVMEQQKKLEETKENFVSVADGIEKSYSQTGQIKKNTGVCSKSRDAVADIISGLAAIAEENAASSEETNASMEELNATMNLLAEAARKLKTISINLDEEVQFFQIEEN
jgi:methyl-accepting chemotaxis protein